MKKVLFIWVIAFLVVTLVGCSNSEEFEVRSYHKDYIEFNNGRFWLSYSIMQEKLDSGEVKDSFLLLKLRSNGEYTPVHRIPKSYYQIGDYILGNENYVFLFSSFDISSPNFTTELSKRVVFKTFPSSPTVYTAPF